MDNEESREEFRGLSALFSRSELSKVQSVVRFCRLLSDGPSKRKCFGVWKEKLYLDWVKKYMLLSSEFLNNDLRRSFSVEDSQAVRIRGNIREVFYQIQHLFTRFQEKKDEFDREKERWLVEKKKLDQYKALESLAFADPLVERINFWKNSLFPESSKESFWELIDHIEPGLKINILESELMKEKKYLEDKVKELQYKEKELIENDRKVRRRKAELKAYQEFLEKQCSLIQKQRFSQEKFTHIEDLEELKKHQDFEQVQSKPLALFDAINTSKFFESEDSCSEIESADDRFTYSIDLSLRATKSAIHSIINKLKFYRVLNLKSSLQIWNSSSKYKVSCKPTIRVKSYSSRRQVEFVNNSNFEKTKKTHALILGKLTKIAVLNLRFFYHLRKKAMFFQWKSQSVKRRSPFKNLHSIRVIYLLTVFLSRGILAAKKANALQSWQMLQQTQRNKELTIELHNIEAKVSENILKDQSKVISFQLNYEKLKSKLARVEQHFSLLKQVNS